MNTQDLGTELQDLAKALGLINDSGFNWDWFGDPLGNLEKIFSHADQRDAFNALLNALITPAQIVGVPSDESWHPLLASQPRGNVYLTVKEDSSNVTFGVAGEFHSATAPDASLRAHLPLFTSSGSNISIIAGAPTGKLEVALRVDVNLNSTIKLDAIDVSLEFQFNPVAVPLVTVTFEQFDLGAGPQDITLDSTNFGSEIVPIVLRLVQQGVSQITGPDPIKDHLLPLLGLSGNPVPMFPFTELTQGPQPLQNWFLSMLEGATPGITEWLEHLAGLLGTNAPTIVGTGTSADPWKVELFAVPGGSTNSGLYVTVSHLTSGATQTLDLGLEFQFIPTSGKVQVGANAVLASIPLAGAAHAGVLPSASVLIQAPGDGTPLVNTAQFSVQTFLAGFTFNGSTLKPMLELDNVQFLGQQPYATIDLTNINSVAADFSDTLRQTLASELGTGTARHLAALAGLVAPVNDPASPHLLDVNSAPLLASNPFAAIGQIHRAALLDNTHSWSHLLEEAAALAGIASTASGSGTAADPWKVALASTGDIALSLAAWNAQTSGNAADVQQLRFGLMSNLNVAPVAATWKAELFTLDLPQSGAPRASVLGAQHLTANISPLPTIPQVGGISLSADTIQGSLDWSLGKPVSWNAQFTNLQLSAAGETKQIASLHFPPTVALDFSNPSAVAASLGVPIPDIEDVLRLLITRLVFEFGGMPSFALSALLGLHGQLKGLPADWPKLADPGVAGSLFTDPFTALRNWFQSLALNVTADETPFLLHALPWFRALLSDALPSVPDGALPAVPLNITGSGVYDDPWTLPLSTNASASIDALVWLESAEGDLTTPPAAWANTLSGLIHGTTDFASLLTQTSSLANYVPTLRNALVAADNSALVTSLTQLAAHLSSTDGVVPSASQVPTSADWTAGTTLTSSHSSQPMDPQAISQILSQIDTWAGGSAGQRTVLLLGPAFSNHTIWNTLLANSNLHGTTDAAATFNLRQANVDPTTIALSGIGNAVWDYYTADLKDDGSGNVTSQVTQIGNIVTRLQQFRPGKKITLVAHSIAGIAARLYAAANAANVHGLITLGTPHLGAGLPFLTDESMANALRILQSIIPSGVSTDQNISALQHIFSALDGYLPPATTGVLPTPNPYPVSSFNPTVPAGLDTAGVPVLAIGSQLSGQLLTSLQQTLGAIAGQQAAPNPAPPKPTHLALGIRAHLPIAGSATTITSDVNLRADAFRLKFDTSAGEPTRPTQILRARAAFTNPGGWLAGAASPFTGPGIPQLDVRVRWAELGADISLNSGISVTPYLALHQFSYHAGLGDLAQFADTAASSLLGAVLHGIGTPTPGSTLDNVLLALKDLGIVVDDSHGGYGVSSDAFAALQTDPAGYLGSQLINALNNGVFGFTSAATGSWTLPLPGVPLSIQLTKTTTWGVGLSTTSSGWSLGSEANLQFASSLSLPAFTPSLTATIQASSLALNFDGSHLNLSLPGYLDTPLQLVPVPTTTQFTATLNNLLPRALFSGAATALLQELIGENIQLPPIDTIFTSPAVFLKSTNALGDGTQLISSKINSLLSWINSKASLPAGAGLQLPVAIQLIAQGTGTTIDPVRLTLQTTAPIDGVVRLQLSANIDSQFHVTPAGNIAVTTSGLPGGAIFGNKISATFGASSSGLNLSIITHADLGSPGPTITILPSFSGFNAVAAAESLLPAALDQLVDALQGEASTAIDMALQVAEAIGIYDTTQKFAGHADDLKKLLSDDWSSVLSLNTPARQQQVATAIANLFGAGPLGAIPDSLTASGSTVVWTLNLAGHSLGTGTVTVTVGWDGSGPTVQLGLNQLSVGSSVGLIGSVNVGYAAGALAFSTDLWVDLHNAIHIVLAPKMHIAYAAGRFTLDLDPLATTTSDGPLIVEISPNPGISGGSDLLSILTSWLLPLAGNILLDVVNSKLDTSLWTGAPVTLKQLLNGTHLIDGATPPHIAAPFPDLLSIATGLLSTLASNVVVPITTTLDLSLVADPDTDPSIPAGSKRLGIALQGSIPFQAGSYDLAMLFGAPIEWNNDTKGHGLNEGIVIYLFDINGTSFTFKPGLDVVGLGFSITGQDDGPLVNSSDFRLGGVEGYLFFDCEFNSSFSVKNFGAGLQLDALGLPLGAATSGGAGGNPVASSLLSQGGGSGDGQSTNPACDLAVWAGAPDDGKFHVLIGGKRDQPLWIGVHASFGPIYIDQIGVQLGDDPDHTIGLLIDGSVKVSGLLAQVQELSLQAPIKDIGNLGKWHIDLQGLAVSFQEPGITLAGGLVKNPGPPIEYDGMLLIQVTEFGFVAVGAYSTPTEGTDHYTSLFVFVAVFATIGIPPIIEISAFGLGIGYNREIIVPDDMNQIPSFVLVAALDDGGALVNDPMGALMKLSTSMPPQRGSFWFAVGLRATTFQIVNIIAVLYIALDSGVEIGILGVARMALPSDDTALVEIELALKARFSSSEGLLSIQAQLTDHSYLISRDCQLTGGFAYFMWFQKSQFLLTMGGYNPNFQKDSAYPDVPRLGYRWSLLGAINIKGESYFALTNTCVMAGTRFEATYGPSCINIWFTAYCDFLISWDPFYYSIDVGVSVGATFQIRVCIFGCCCSIDITVSVGASLEIKGPPFHGEVTVDLAICSVTVPFGPTPNSKPPALAWDQFSQKYIYNNDPNTYATAVHVISGLLPPVPAGGSPAPGTADQPWKMASEWVFQTESRVAAVTALDFLNKGLLPADAANIASIDLAPMYMSNAGSEHTITLEQLDLEGGSATYNQWQRMTVGNPRENFDLDPARFSVEAIIGQVSEATYHYFPDDQVPAAARTVPVLAGLKITGLVKYGNHTGIIPISKLVDTGDSRPLPFAADIDLTGLLAWGTAADTLAVLAKTASTTSLLNASAQLLSGSNEFTQLRVASGLPAPGLAPMSVRSLKRQRSSPPLLTPLTTGLTMKPVGLSLPPKIAVVPAAISVLLEQPRLRAALQARAQAASDAPVSLKTTVTTIAAAKQAIRMAAPSLDTLAGARLVRVPSPTAPRATMLAHSGKALRTGDLGAVQNIAAIKSFTQAVTDFTGKGIQIVSGVTHVWDLPSVIGQQIVITGTGAVRVAFLDRTGTPVEDSEYIISKQLTLPVPANTAMVAITCLGAPSTTTPTSASGFGAVSVGYAPQGQQPVVGWQIGNHAPQISGRALLVRGGTLLLSTHYIDRQNKQKTSDTLAQISYPLADQVGTETRLPVQIDTILVLLDRQDANAASKGDLAIGVTGATIQTPPLIVVGGTHTALLYPITAHDDNTGNISVAVGSLSGYQVAGVAGLSGSAQTWAVRWNGKIPEHVVPDGPLTPDGSVTVQIQMQQGGTQ
jgi:large repetitive protein